MMNESDARAALKNTGLESALRWAAPLAFAQTADDYDEDRGHDQFIIGGHNFVYLRDHLDRCTGNGRYVLAPDAPSDGRDFLGRGIPAEAFEQMPRIEPGQIARRDYQRSPGWAADGVRIVLQSFKFGQVDRIKWGRPAKKRVASQLYFTANTLFDDDDYGLESLPGIPDDDDFDGTTLVAAHSFNPVTGQYEIYVGQSRVPEFRGDACWYWRDPLLRGGTQPSESVQPVTPTLPGDAPSGQADEINVTLKRPRQRGNGSGND